MASRQAFRTALIPALRRVDGVCLVVGPGPVQAQVFGVGHRLPATVPVSIGLAARLIEAGAPLTLRTPAPAVAGGS